MCEGLFIVSVYTAVYTVQCICTMWSAMKLCAICQVICVYSRHCVKQRLGRKKIPRPRNGHVGWRSQSRRESDRLWHTHRESDKMSVMRHVWYYISANFKCWMDVCDILIRIVRWSFYWWFLEYTFDTWRISGWKVVTWLTWNTRDCMPYFIRVWGASSIPCPILNYSAFSYFRATILGWRLSRYRDWSDWEIYDSSTICREIEVDIECHSVILENDYRRRSVGWLIFSRWSPSKQPQRRLFKGWTIVICVFVYFIL